MAEVLEAAMLICFGLSWPLNAYKNFKAGTAAGTSWQFILLITLGYVAGITAKFVGNTINWVLVVYFLNLICIGVNWAVYFRNRRLDARHLGEERASSLADTTVERVLVAVDGSKASMEALGFASHAIDLAHAPHIEVVSVAEPTEAGRSKAREAARAAEEFLAARGIESVVTVREGDPAAAIVTEAKADETGLLIMGSRGLSGLRSFVLGSVSREVSENVGCPVLIVK